MRLLVTLREWAISLIAKNKREKSFIYLNTKSEDMKKYYTIYAKNLYVVAATLVHLRVPFNFHPHKTYRKNENRSPYRKSTIDLELDEQYLTLSDILYEMNEKYGSTFDLEIISEA